VYAGVRGITNWIFINSARWIRIEYLIVGIKWVRIAYSIIGMIVIHRSEYLIVGITRLVESELNIQ
jgi:hypothetical protein